jgi:ABC-type nickel/cobalt efflux system permease component RcnA
MFAILGMGFVLGLQHAMEADHVAAVASIVAGRRRPGHILRHGLFWGLGHALALSAFAGVVILARGEIPEGLAASLELAVGFMLIALGGLVIWRVIRQQLHFHVHRHRDGNKHFHAHSHAGEKQAHAQAKHQHEHPKNGTRRSLFVGVMHGLAGSAALVALAAPGQWLQGIGFVALFGLGSIAGMVLLTSVIALPMMYSGRLVTGLNNGLQVVIGLVSIGLGGFYASEQAPTILALFTSA